MYSRVVVAYDGSARSLSALPVAQASALLFDCPVELAHVPVAEDPPTLDRDDVVVLASDDPADGLIAHVRTSEPAGLVCLSTRGRGAVGEALFGSTAAAVVRGLHAPALVVGPKFGSSSSTWTRMLVCLDASETSAAILPVVEQWGRATGMRLHLLHVTYPLGDEVRAGEESEETRIVAAELRRTATELTAAGIETTWDVVEDTEGLERNNVA